MKISKGNAETNSLHTLVILIIRFDLGSIALIERTKNQVNLIIPC